MRTPLKYNPGFLSDEELIRAFVVRKHDLALLVQMVEQNSSTDSNQHVLVVGQRGIGKTTLVRRAGTEIRSNPILTERWTPIAFAEETYSATSPAELWLEALLRLYNQTNKAEWLESYERIRGDLDEARASDAALSTLLDFADQSKTKLVLIIENFSMLVQQFEKSANWNLRHTLSNERRLMLVATAPSRFSEVDDLDAAWFEFFVVHELKPLSLRECRTLWKSLTTQAIPLSQARAIEILTGGNPRLIRILSDFAVKKSFRQLVEDLTGLIDEHTEYFKSQLDVLPPAERKVLVALLENWKPAEAREVADTARIEVSKASALLNRLTERGFVTSSAAERKKRRYQVSERLFNIYYLMRRQGHPADRVRAAVRFMVVLYRDGQLIDTVKRLAGEACELEPQLRRDHFIAYEEVIKCELDPALRHAIIDATPSAFARQMPKQLSELIQGFEVAHRSAAVTKPQDSAAERSVFEAIQAMKQKDFADAEKTLLAAIESEPQNGHLWSHLGDAMIGQNKLEKAVDALQKAISLGERDGWVWGRLSNSLHGMGKYAEAAAASREVIALLREPSEKAQGLGILGHLLGIHLGKTDEAEALLNEAFTLDPKVLYPYVVLCFIRLNQFPQGDIREVINRAAESGATDSKEWLRLADRCHENARYPEAEICLRRILEFEPKSKEAWSHLAELLWFHLSRRDEAEHAIRESIQLDQKDASAHARLAMMLREKGSSEEAEQEARTATNLDGSCQPAWSELGTIHYEKKRFVESEIAFRKAVELEPDDFSLWCDLGLALEKAGKLAEAQGSFRRSVELVKSVPKGHASLSYVHAVALALGRSTHWSESFDIARRFIDAADADEGALGLTTDFVIRAAAKNQLNLAVETLEASPARGSYEPLLVALRKLKGEQVNPPLEIAEIAEDIIKRVANARIEEMPVASPAVN